MKKTAIVLAMAVLTSMTAFAQQWERWETSGNDRPKITVSGEAAVNVTPDKIVISFGVVTSDAELVAAKQKNNDQLTAGLAAIKEYGVTDQQIQTDQLSIEQRYDNQTGVPIGYVVRNMLIVEVKSAADVEEVVTRALQAGVNRIQGVDFQTTESRKYRDQARDMALIAAREKAERMAATLGQSLGSPLQIQENSAPTWCYSSWAGGGWGRGQSMSSNVSVNAMTAPAEMSDTIAPGKIAVRANVSVTFELKNKS